MNIIHFMWVFSILLIIFNGDAFTNASRADSLDFFIDNQVNIFGRLKKLEESDSKKKEQENQLEDLKLLVKEQENEISDLKEKAAEMSKAKKSQDETNEWLKSQIRKSDFSSKFHH